MLNQRGGIKHHPVVLDVDVSGKYSGSIKIVSRLGFSEWLASTDRG
ncbi:MAG: hypothetical protein ACXAB7_13250 [Candidatus Kariarchaeaceae archaeon]